jgi:hypothetical protein
MNSLEIEPRSITVSSSGSILELLEHRDGRLV